MEVMGIIVAVLALLAWIIFGSQKNAESLPNLSLPPNIRRWDDIIATVANEYRVPPDILASVIAQESAGIPDVPGEDGEVGLMQVRQIAVDELHRLGYTDLPGVPAREPIWNVRQGAAYLSEMLNQQGNIWGALVAYNAGPSGAEDQFLTPGDQQSERYANEVLIRAKKYRNE